MKLAKCFLVLVAAGVMLTGECAAQSRDLTATEKKVIATAYGRLLKDPHSAQYQWPQIPVKPQTQNAQTAYCFQVNAKNSYGGYTGFKRIIGKVRQSAGKIVAFDYVAGHLDDTPALIQTTVDMCRIFGIRF